jgi:hypothetical protein
MPGTTVQKPVIRTASGSLLTVEPETEHPVSIEEMLKRRDVWLTRNREKLKGYSVDRFIAEKRRDVEAGLE